MAAVLALTGCLEPPVSESLEIRMLGGGASIVKVDVALRDPADYHERPKVRERFEAEARAIDERRDAWSRRFESTQPARQTDTFDRKAGRLEHVSRGARLESIDDLRSFLHDGAIAVSYADGEGWAELTLSPPRGGGRAGPAVRERVARELNLLCGRLADYFTATGALYAYVDSHPERARALLGTVLQDSKTHEELGEEESRLVEDVRRTIDALATLLDVPEGEAETLDELSRSVFDPFPAAIAIGVPGPILEREGFDGTGDDPLRIPLFSLWHAFSRLEGRWLSPDPALAMWRADAAGKEVDATDFASRPRRANPHPAAAEIRKAIETELQPAPVYRVKWRPTAVDPDDDPLMR